MKIELEVPDDFPLPLADLRVQKIGNVRTRKVVSYTTNKRGLRTSETLSCGHVLRPPPRGNRTQRVCPSCEERLGRIVRRFYKKPSEATINVIDVIAFNYRAEHWRHMKVIEELRATIERLVNAERERKIMLSRAMAVAARRRKSG